MNECFQVKVSSWCDCHTAINSITLYGSSDAKPMNSLLIVEYWGFPEVSILGELKQVICCWMHMSGWDRTK